MRKIQRYGWRPDLPDHRDYYLGRPSVLAVLPPAVDLRAKMPPVVDQGELGSCTANAIAGAHQFEQLRQNENAFAPSRLFIYYNERSIEGDVDQDNGAQIRDGIASIASQGVCPETEWVYDISQFTVKPSDQCYTDALNHTAIQYLRVPQESRSIRACLAFGYPIVFGFTVYESFESQMVASSGVVNMPGPGESVVGGHAVVLVGYDTATQRFIVRNSWGSGWGQAGYFTIPFEYVLNAGLASDFWSIRLVE
jgi:C1A family cysteine protease